MMMMVEAPNITLMQADSPPITTDVQQLCDGSLRALAVFSLQGLGLSAQKGLLAPIVEPLSASVPPIL